MSVGQFTCRRESNRRFIAFGYGYIKGRTCFIIVYAAGFYCRNGYRTGSYDFCLIAVYFKHVVSRYAVAYRSVSAAACCFQCKIRIAVFFSDNILNTKCRLICFFDFKACFRSSTIIIFCFCYRCLNPVFACIFRHFACAFRTAVSSGGFNRAIFIGKVFVGYRTVSFIVCNSRLVWIISICPACNCYRRYKRCFCNNYIYLTFCFAVIIVVICADYFVIYFIRACIPCFRYI